MSTFTILCPFCKIPKKRSGTQSGLWDEWNGEKSATIITTEPSEWMSQYQDRLPLILKNDEVEKWPYASREIKQQLNKPRDPNLVAEIVSGQQSLF